MKGVNQWPAFEDDDYGETYRPAKGTKLILQWKRIQKILDFYWDVWRKDYLLSLREQWRYDNKVPKCDFEPRVGAIVQVADKVPRRHWRLGRIVKLHQSADGSVRTADVKLWKGNVIRRALRFLYPIELSSECLAKTAEDVSESINQGQRAVGNERPPRRQAARRANAAIQGILADEEGDSSCSQ
jgi:hypothetical protein